MKMSRGITPNIKDEGTAKRGPKSVMFDLIVAESREASSEAEKLFVKYLKRIKVESIKTAELRMGIKDIIL